ncbi:DoxX family protein [Streptomyces sp. NBC_01515]|uniref:DoxX family protein n=1 Tax=Streptomyces sp. NBC_01515 TaxID=2903890 RepID=UPI003870C0C9
MNVVSIVLAVLLAVFFAPLGLAKLLALAPMRALAAESGMSTTAYRRIGALEVAAAAGVLLGLAVPILGTAAGTGLLALLVGAVIIHVRRGDGPQKYAAAVVTAVLVIVYLAAHLGATG